MPIYEFQCSDCGHVTEVIQSISAPPPESCPNCGKSSMTKLVSNSNFVLKGGGWYKDGYAGTSGNSGTSGSSGTSSSSSDSGSTSTSSSSDSD